MYSKDFEFNSFAYAVAVAFLSFDLLYHREKSVITWQGPVQHLLATGSL